MANTMRGYLDALHALSGDNELKAARHNLIQGLCDATLHDVVVECLRLNTSRVIREHIIKLLLDTFAAQRQSPRSHGHGYLDALCALSGNPDLAAARQDLIQQLTDVNLNEIITSCLGGGTSRASQEQVIEFLLDVIAEQTRSRAQQGAFKVEEDDYEELLAPIEEPGQDRMRDLPEVESEEVHAVLDECEATEVDKSPNTDRISVATTTALKRRRSADEPNHPEKRAGDIRKSRRLARNATPEDTVVETGTQAEKEKSIEAAGHILVSEGKVSKYHGHVEVKSCISDTGAHKELGSLPTEVRSYLSTRLAEDYGFYTSDRTSHNNITKYGDPLQWERHCINTVLNNQNPCTWFHGKKAAMCDYCVQTGQICARFKANSNCTIILVIHSLDQQYRKGIKSHKLEFWIQKPQKVDNTETRRQNKEKARLLRQARKTARASKFMQQETTQIAKSAHKTLEVEQTKEADKAKAEAPKVALEIEKVRRARRAEEESKARGLKQAKKAQTAEELLKATDTYFGFVGVDMRQQQKAAREARMKARSEARDARMVAEEAEEKERARSSRVLRKR